MNHDSSGLHASAPEPAVDFKRVRQISWYTAALGAVISLTIAVRLVQIRQPYIDHWSWRQADTAMIARNFFRHGFNLLYPQIDWAGSAPGYVGTEFPLVPYIAALLYVPLGIHEWIGRALSVAFAALSVPFLANLVKRESNRETAVLATLVYALAPLSVLAGRSFMSDMASLALSIIALDLFARWQAGEGGKLTAVLAACTAALGIMIKLPAVAIGVPLLWVAWRSHASRILRSSGLWVFAAAVLLPAGAWYVHTYRTSLMYEPYHMFGGGGIGLALPGEYLAILARLGMRSLTLPLAVTALLGLLITARTQHLSTFRWWCLAVAVFVLLAGPGNRHDWYQLPFVPIAAAFAGFASDRALRMLWRLYPRRLAGVALLALYGMAVASASYRSLEPLYEPWAAPARTAGHAVKSIAAADALVVAVDDGDPTLLYYSERRGWHLPRGPGGLPSSSEEAIAELERARDAGASYLIFTRHTRWWLEDFRAFGEHVLSQYTVLISNPDYVIFTLR